MVKRITSRILIFFTSDWSVLEFYGSTCKIFWGLYVLQPSPTFRSISGYTSVSNEVYWGWGLFIIGILHFTAIVMHKLGWKNMIWMRRLCLWLGMMSWVFISFVIWKQAGISPILIFFANLAFFMFLNFLRLWIPEERRELDLGRPDGLPDRRAPS